jgi:hypothetical protein
MENGRNRVRCAILQKARWGDVGQGLRPIKMTLKVTGRDIFVPFLTRRNQSVELKLTEGKSLLGTVKWYAIECPMRLKKVD